VRSTADRASADYWITTSAPCDRPSADGRDITGIERRGRRHGRLEPLPGGLTADSTRRWSIWRTNPYRGIHL